MNEPKHKVIKADDGTYTVEIIDGIGGDAEILKFGKKQADDFVREERRKLGIDARWSETPDD